VCGGRTHGGSTALQIWVRQPVQAGSFEDEPVGPYVDWQPALDIYEAPDRFLLVFALPGVRAQDVEAVVVDRSFIIRGTRHTPIPAGVRTHLIESARGSFERRMRLPTNADLAGLRTRLTSGQLLVRIPKQRTGRVRVRVTTA
jgi:HSP20 family molecular chaperone IbpA